MVVALGWFVESSGLSTNYVYNLFVCRFEYVMHKLVRALRFDVELAQGAVGEVFKVVRDDYLGVASDCRSGDMAVAFVWEFDCFDEGLISGDKAVGNGPD
ncbi:MAG: hypothetical protein F4135_09245 [Acidimicrobiia bacterium]|nr:hypothetical protein [Acidimicrobiia bacterium]